MKVTTEERANREVRVNIEVESADLEPAMQEAARRLAKQVNVPGFRKGHAPYNIVLNYFGRQALLEEALEPLTQEMYRKALVAADLHPVAPGQLEDVDYDPLVLHMVVPLAPAVDPGPYREFRLPFEEPAVGDELLDAQIEYMRQQQAVVEPAERPAQLGDRVRVGVTLDGLKPDSEEPDERLFSQDDWELDLRESLNFPAPGFAQYLAGMSAGEEKRVTVEYPADYDEESLRGKRGLLTLKLADVKGVTLPEVNDDFAKSAGEYENLLDLRMHVREQLLQMLTERAEQQYAGEVVTALAENAKLEYPPVLLEEELDEVVHEFESRVQEELHLKIEDWLKTRGKTMEQLRADFHDRAQQRLRQTLVLSEISKREALAVGADELETETERLLEPFGGENVDIARQIFTSPENRQQIAANLLTRKTVNRLMAIARGQAVPEPGTAAEEPSGEVVEAPAAEIPPVAGGGGDVPPKADAPASSQPREPGAAEAASPES